MKYNAAFEGFYLKHQNKADTISFIPGASRDGYGKKEAFLQIITSNCSAYIPYPLQSFSIQHDPFLVKVGNNMFCEKGAILGVNTKKVQCVGAFSYGAFTQLQKPVMGPLTHLPIECSHIICSTKHTVDGRVWFNGKMFEMKKGVGYIEGDAGRSFPKRYCWMQCNRFNNRRVLCTITAAAATLPMGNLQIPGTFCVIQYKGKELRLATYCGAHVLCQTKDCFILKQRGYLLIAEVLEFNSQALKAPQLGQMCRTIQESVSCKMRFRLFENHQQVFDLESPYASFEWVP